MKMGRALLACAVVVLGTVSCQRGPLTMPTKKVPAGIVLIDMVKKPGALRRLWTSAIVGPVDLAIDGTRIPVAQTPKGGYAIEIKGLAPGKHRYFLSSPHDAFGPDQGEIEVTEGKGTYLMLFNAKFKATLYGEIEPLPKPEGLPGVTARLVR